MTQIGRAIAWIGKNVREPLQHQTACCRSGHEPVEPLRAFSQCYGDDASAVSEATQVAGRAQLAPNIAGEVHDAM